MEKLTVLIGLLGPLLLLALVFVYNLGQITALLDAVFDYFFMLLIGLTLLGFVCGLWSLFKRRFKPLIILGVILTGSELWFYCWLIYFFNNFFTY